MSILYQATYICLRQKLRKGVFLAEFFEKNYCELQLMFAKKIT